MPGRAIELAEHGPAGAVQDELRLQRWGRGAGGAPDADITPAKQNVGSILHGFVFTRLGSGRIDLFLFLFFW